MGLAVGEVYLQQGLAIANGDLFIFRNYKLLNDYYSFAPASSLSISQRGLLGVAVGPNLMIWKDALQTKQEQPYMKHLVPGNESLSIDENSKGKLLIESRSRYCGYPFHTL